MEFKNKTTFYLKSGKKVSFYNHGNIDDLVKKLDRSRLTFLQVKNYLFKVDSIEYVEYIEFKEKHEINDIKNIIEAYKEKPYKEYDTDELIMKLDSILNKED